MEAAGPRGLESDRQRVECGQKVSDAKNYAILPQEQCPLKRRAVTGSVRQAQMTLSWLSDLDLAGL